MMKEHERREYLKTLSEEKRKEEDVIHTVKGFGIVSKVEVDVFLALSCFFDD